MYVAEKMIRQEGGQRNCLACENGGWSEPLSEEELKGILRRFDVDRDGQYTRTELKDAFHSLGSRCPTWRSFRAISHADTNGDGLVNQDELVHLLNYVTRLGYVS